VSKVIYTFLMLMLFSTIGEAQSVQSLINAASLEELTRLNREFSGEDSSTVNGNRVLIKNRVSNQGNEIAADYLQEYFENLSLPVTNHKYRSTGRNVIATQIGLTHPENIYIICAHYDAVANYCADDNVSGTATVLEAARILSNFCFENTIIYALWDEEEIGLVGSRFFSDSLFAEGANVLGVLNMDMMAFDGNNDKKFDIDVRNIANSIAIQDTLISLVEQLNLDLIPLIVNPGTSASDHASFWRNDYSAVLLGESWETNDRNPFYHTANDRVSLYNWPYYFELSKLAIAYIATMAEPAEIDTTVVSDGGVQLTAQFSGGTYQWLDCTTNQPILGATEAIFVASASGEYAVIVGERHCFDTSGCHSVIISDVHSDLSHSVKVYPNPMQKHLQIDIGNLPNVSVNMFDALGRQVANHTNIAEDYSFYVADLPKGYYLLQVISEGEQIFFHLVK
jgi:hypothetical protein